MRLNALITGVLFLCLGTVRAYGLFEPKNRPIDVQHYDVLLTADPKTDKTRFEGEVTLKVLWTSDADKLELDAEKLKVHSVTVNGQAAKYVASSDVLLIALPSPVPSGSVSEVKIQYTGPIHVEQSGLFRVQDPDAPERGTLLFTQFEALGARRTFPCNDEPTDKATMTMGALVPKSLDVLSSGVLVSDKTVTRHGKPWHEVRWKLDKPHSTYLANIAIGDFAKLEKMHRGIPVSVHTSAKTIKKAQYVLDQTVRSMAFFEAYLQTPYPWPKYASVGVPTFTWGGMENTSISYLNQDRMLVHDTRAEEEKLHTTGLTAHELGHQWFGDLVTMEWWNDIWLNEAFASFAGFKASEALFSKDEAAIHAALWLWEDYFRQEDGPRSHSIVRTDLVSPSDAFDSISYAKGEQVLRTLETFLGQEAFRKGLAEYLKKYAFANATYRDFFEVMASVSGKNLNRFRDSWLLQRGYPVVSYRGKWNAEDKELKLTVFQKSNHVGDDALFAFRMPVSIHRETAPSYHQELVVEFNGKRSKEEILAALPAEPEWVTLNPAGTVLARIEKDQSGLARVSDDEKAVVQNEPSLRLQARHDPDAVSRVWAWNALAHPLKEGKALSAESQAVLAEALVQETSPYVRVGFLNAFERLGPKSLPTKLSQAVVDGFMASGKETAAMKNDEHGWKLWRTRLLRHLAKANHPKVFELVAEVLKNSSATLDEVAAASYAMASTGDRRAMALLETALKKQGKRGYRFGYWVQCAMAAFPSENTVKQIRKIASTATSDLLGRLPWVIRDNTAVKTSPQWAKFLEEFMKDQDRYGEAVKIRMLSTIEDVKTDFVRELVTKLASENTDEEIRESAKRILEKNFTPHEG